MRRIYITGIGVVTPVGNDCKEFWNSLITGRSGIRRLQHLDLDGLAVTIGGQIRDLDFERANLNGKVTTRKMDKATIYAVIATREALANAGLPEKDLGKRCGVIIGSGLAGLETLQQQTENLLGRGPRTVSPFTIPVLMPNAAPANICLAFGATGSCHSVASACSSSGHAMIDAFELLRRGQADVVIAGGTESPMTRLAISAFANMRATTKKYNDNPQKASRPFDSARDGFVLSEGAAILIFESEQSARKRGAKILAEMVGYGTTMDAHHLVQPDPEAHGAIRAISQTLEMAGWNPAEIAEETYVSAHGTSTKFNDLMETGALKVVFGESVSKLKISSTKSVTGHMIGAACATEMAACVFGLNEGLLPPTVNYEIPDPECDLDYIPNESRKADVRFALNNSFGFGGHNVCIAIQKFNP